MVTTDVSLINHSTWDAEGCRQNPSSVWCAFYLIPQLKPLFLSVIPPVSLFKLIYSLRAIGSKSGAGARVNLAFLSRWESSNSTDPFCLVLGEIF
jgi:hypothetical protein